MLALYVHICSTSLTIFMFHREKRTIEARDWTKERTKGQELLTVNEQGEVRLLSAGKETEGNMLDLDDVDPGK